MKTINLYLIRHGQTIFNVMDKLQGWADSPLTEKGKDLAKNTGQRLADLKLDQVYSSDSKRAIDTAKIIINENKYVDTLSDPLPEFREAFFGSFEGLDNESTWAKIAKPYNAKNQAEMLEQVGPFGVRDRMHAADTAGFAENGDQFLSRIKKGINEVLDNAEDATNVMVVSHGTLIRALTIEYGDESMNAIHVFPSNGSYTKLTVNSEIIKVNEYNIL